MTWSLRKKDSRCSVTREQEVWGEYGIYTAHKHKYLFKIIHKRHLKAPKKEVQTPPKSSPRHHLEPKNHSDGCQGQKKTNFERPGPPSRAPKGPQSGPPNGTKSTKIQDLYAIPKKHHFWCQFRSHRSSFWRVK